MKNFIPALALPLLIFGCAHASQGEAMDTCEEWKAKGNSINMEVLKTKERDHLGWEFREAIDGDKHLIGTANEDLISYEAVLNQRVCVLEPETRQVIGRNNKYISMEFEYSDAEFSTDWADWRYYKIVKYFKY